MLVVMCVAELHPAGFDDQSLDTSRSVSAAAADEADKTPVGRSSASKSGLKGKAATAQALADLESIVVCIFVFVIESETAVLRPFSSCLG